jgi:hypothetical protein
MKTKAAFFMVVAMGLAAGCAPPTVPNRPSWDQDVFPILQGSCGHCHGETVGRLPSQPLSRLDICNTQVFADAGIPLAVTAAQVWGAQFNQYLLPVMGSPRPKMPPPPAAELSDYERDVLLKWGADGSGDKCNKQGRNREPDMRVIGEPRWDGNDVTIVVEVWDPDKDQVLGKVSVGMATAIIPSAGRREVTVTGANRNDPITVLLHDGYVGRTFDL